ncbi:MAG: hypothetical protein HDQ88_02535 [Clostridia bacterium]|nr:hypothetical protein [Clostridia bacterium]
MFVHEYECDDDVKLWMALTWNEIHKEYLIHAFSDDKDMFDAYMSIHNKDAFKVTTYKAPLDEINKIANHNMHAEIDFYLLETRDPKHPSKVKKVPVPMTGDEMNQFNQYRAFMSFNGDEKLYEFIYNNVEYLADEYKDALMVLNMDEMCRYMLGKPGSTPFLNEVQFDELRFFFKVHAEKF